MPFVGSFGPWEMIFILVVVLLVFGAKRLPEIGSSMGKGIREFKRSFSDIQDEINRPAPQERRDVRPTESRPAVPPPPAGEEPSRPREEAKSEQP